MENSVRVTDGLFSVMLGSLNTNLASVVQSHSTLYLGIAVGNDSEMTPRVQLGSVPFSIWSLTVADNSVTSAKIAEGAVGSREIANGSVTVDEIAEGVVDINFKGVERRGVRMEAFESDTFSMGWQEGSTYDLIWVFPEPFTEPPLIVATSRELSYCRYINWDVWFVSTTEARFIGVRSVSQPDAQYFTSQCRLNVLAIGH